MRSVHLIVGWAIVGGFALLWIWRGGAWLVGRIAPRFRTPAGRAFWTLLGFLQATLLVQGIVGVVILVGGGRASALHYVYGVVFPILLLLVAHVLARDLFRDRPSLPFAWASFFVFGLTLRALMTGLGYP